MKLYNVKVLLHGDIQNQVRKEMVTAAEIALLRRLHEGNNDAVTEIVHVANVNRSDEAERRRLARIYAPNPFAFEGDVPQSGIERVNALFPPGATLPQEVPPLMLGDAKAAALLEENETIDWLHPLEQNAVDAGQEQIQALDGSPIQAAAIATIADPVSIEDNPFADEGVTDIILDTPEPAPRRSPLRTATRTAV